MTGDQLLFIQNWLTLEGWWSSIKNFCKSVVLWLKCLNQDVCGRVVANAGLTSNSFSYAAGLPSQVAVDQKTAGGS
jgi:hypothetical protein